MPIHQILNIFFADDCLKIQYCNCHIENSFSAWPCAMGIPLSDLRSQPLPQGQIAASCALGCAWKFSDPAGYDWYVPSRLWLVQYIALLFSVQADYHVMTLTIVEKPRC